MTLNDFSPRERDVLKGWLCGMSQKEIAGVLGVSVSSVKHHLRLIYLRAGINGGIRKLRLVLALYNGGNGPGDYAVPNPHPPYRPVECSTASPSKRRASRVVDTSPSSPCEPPISRGYKKAGRKSEQNCS